MDFSIRERGRRGEGGWRDFMWEIRGGSWEWGEGALGREGGRELEGVRGREGWTSKNIFGEKRE